MIKINDIEIAQTDTEYGIRWADGHENWGFEDVEEARDLAWVGQGAVVIKRHVFTSVTEVAE